MALLSSRESWPIEPGHPQPLWFWNLRRSMCMFHFPHKIVGKALMLGSNRSGFELLLTIYYVISKFTDSQFSCIKWESCLLHWVFWGLRKRICKMFIGISLSTESFPLGYKHMKIALILKNKKWNSVPFLVPCPLQLRTHFPFPLIFQRVVYTHSLPLIVSLHWLLNSLWLARFLFLQLHK